MTISIKHILLTPFVICLSQTATGDGRYNTENPKISLSSKVEANQANSPSSQDETPTQKVLSGAALLLAKGQYNDCINRLVNESKGLTPDELIILSKCYEKSNQLKKQKETLEQVTLQFPKLALGFTLFGKSCVKSTLEEVNLDPKGPAPLACINSLRKAIELDPDLREAYENLSFAYDQYQYYYELRILTEDQIKRFGESPSLFLTLCRLNAQDNYFKQGRELCVKAAKANPKIPDPYIYLALMEANQNHIEKSEQWLKSAAKRFPTSEFVAANYGDFLVQQKNILLAEKLYLKGTLNNPESYRSQLGLAKTSFDLKHFDQALRALKALCQIEPHSAYTKMKFYKDYLRLSKETAFEKKYSANLDFCQSQAKGKPLTKNQKDEMETPFSLYCRFKVPPVR